MFRARPRDWVIEGNGGTAHWRSQLRHGHGSTGSREHIRVDGLELGVTGVGCGLGNCWLQAGWRDMIFVPKVCLRSSFSETGQRFICHALRADGAIGRTHDHPIPHYSQRVVCKSKLPYSAHFDSMAKPVAYVMLHRWFVGFDFVSDEGVPKPEIAVCKRDSEYLKQNKKWNQPTATRRLLLVSSWCVCIVALRSSYLSRSTT